MTILLGEQNKAVVGTLRKFTITPATPRETLLGTPVNLGTTEPATAQISYTIQQSDLPTISPSVPMIYNACIVVAGRNAAGTSATVTYRTLKNGVSTGFAAGTATAATNYWGQTHWRFSNVQVGDVLEVKVYGNNALLNYDFHGLIVYPSRPEVAARGAILLDLNLSGGFSPSFVTAGVSSPNNQSFFVNPVSNLITSAASVSSNTSLHFNALCQNKSHAIYRLAFGTGTTEQGAETTTAYNNATARQYQRQAFPTSISFREIQIK